MWGSGERQCVVRSRFAGLLVAPRHVTDLPDDVDAVKACPEAWLTMRWLCRAWICPRVRMHPW